LWFNVYNDFPNRKGERRVSTADKGDSVPLQRTTTLNLTALLPQANGSRATPLFALEFGSPLFRKLSIAMAVS
jgi:hypothetical protein